MRRLEIPGTPFVASRLGFGTASLHHLPTAGQRQALLTAALDAGITHFDTAPMYGEGLAERSLGRMLREQKGREVTIATKVGFPSRRAGAYPWLMYVDKAIGIGLHRMGVYRRRSRRRALNSRDVAKSVDASLRNLGLKHLHLLLIHEPHPGELRAIHELMPLLNRLKAAGTIGLLGMAGSASACIAIAGALPGAFDILQVEDSTVGHEADVVLQSGHPLQITYGYLRLAAARAGGSGIDENLATAVLGEAFRRNASGMILVSSRKPKRITAFAEICRQIDS